MRRFELLAALDTVRAFRGRSRGVALRLVDAFVTAFATDGRTLGAEDLEGTADVEVSTITPVNADSTFASSAVFRR